MTSKWEYAILDGIVMPMGSCFKHVAGPTLAASLDVGSKCVFVSMGPYAGTARKFLFVETRGAIVYYKHCRIAGEMLAMRKIEAKVFSIAANLASHDNVNVIIRKAFTGDVMMQQDFQPKTTIGELKQSLRKVMM